jgi:putative acetyltransferase
VAGEIVIRPERDADHSVIADIVRGAFVRHPDEVALFVERIRASEHYVPELALVAEDADGVIAHVMLSWVGVDGGARASILNLTPMSVRPDRQRAGVGRGLVWDALRRAEAAGVPAGVGGGVAGCYPRCGVGRAVEPRPEVLQVVSDVRQRERHRATGD